MIGANAAPVIMDCYRQQVSSQTQDARHYIDQFFVARVFSYTTRHHTKRSTRMINRESIDKLAQQIGDLFGQSTLPQDIQRNLRGLIQSGFDKMDLVTRDEFDTQTAVLERTRAKLDQLEKQLNELTQLNNPPH